MVRVAKGLPADLWPRADHDAFARAYRSGSIFDDQTGPGAHLSEGSRRFIKGGYRRWMGFLSRDAPDDLNLPPADRITPERVREHVLRLEAEVGDQTLAIMIEGLYGAAKLISPARDWSWLRAIHVRLKSRIRPSDRYEKLVPAWKILDHGIWLMDDVVQRGPRVGHWHYIQYRDGVLLSVLSMWPLRRRSVAALTVSRHVEFDEAGINLHVFAEDMKMKRPESFRLPDLLVPYFKRYLRRFRPKLLTCGEHDGLWSSHLGTRMTGTAVYRAFRRRTAARFGRAMTIHDMRRATSTFLAMEAPEMISLVPGVLQHSSDETSDRYYNLARSTAASKRYVAVIDAMKSELSHFRDEP